MAEVHESSTSKHKGVKRGKKLSTRVDLTPMVDLGFLLITFFIFTTTMSQPTAMRFITPDDRDTTNPTLAAESKTISLLLKENNQIEYYFGMDAKTIATTTYDKDGLRNILLNKLKSIRLANGSNDDMVVLIKPTADATYKNLVDVMDEMLINGIKKYAVVK
ncbi:MAG: biopolymer transporter ExbD [Chitinophagaceae bacterium]|nr:biopolymer transporter ExbD [Chitinophagaceae bacterium]